MQNNEFKVGDLVIVDKCIDDPVAEVYLNDHATIIDMRPPHIKLQFLNGDIHTVLIDNIRKQSN